MASEENIRVAVRLRPFLPQVENESNGKVKRIVHMDELSSTVSLSNPDNPVALNKFSFDNILWSFDGFSEQPDGYLASDNKAATEEIYCDQKQVYEEIGKEIIQNLWNGHSSSIFTFGESKSGKSWTLVGLGANKGIVPQVFTDLFKGVREKEKAFQQNGSTLEVRLSMAEIYNERVKDLLPATPSSSGNSTKLKNLLKIREHSRKGFYIEGLRSVLTINHEDIQQRLEEGLVNKAMYLTNCNATSENSMTIITVTLVQKIRNHRGDEVTRTSTLDVFDLPACELVGNCATNKENDGDEEEYFVTNSDNLRKNGTNYFSKCIDRLLEVSIGTHQDPIPFHSHSVTKLLKNALSGNSKTWMVATLSPCDLSYRHSLFVLQLAEKVRMLTTRSVINEEVTSKLIRELKGDSEKLKKLISLGDFEMSEYSSHRPEHVGHLTSTEREALKRRITEDMKAQIRDNEKEIRNLQQPVEERIKLFKSEKNDLGKKIENDRKSKCHVYNINGDAQVTGKIIVIIPLGTVDFGYIHNNGGKSKENNHFISFCGPGIQEHHGTFSYNSKDGKISIKPAGPNCRILVNETPIVFDTVLAHNDRIILGGSQIWIYQNPKENWLEKYSFPYKMHYEYILEQVAVKSEVYQNFNPGILGESLQKQLVNLIPPLDNCKSMAEDLNQNYIFQALLLQPIDVLLRNYNNGASSSNNNSKTSYSEKTGHYTDKSKDSSILLVKVQNTVDGSFSFWSYDEFFDRLEVLKDSYMQFLEDGDAPMKEIDAFKESSDSDVPIGYCVISLKPLAYLINIENSAVPILDYATFQTIGQLNFSLHFLDESGEKMNDEDVFIESPDELLDDNLTVVMSIKELQNITLHFKEIYCKYKFLEEGEETTKYLDSKATFMGISNKHEKKYVIEPVTDNSLNTMLTQHLVLRLFGKQRVHKMLNLEEGLPTLSKPYDRGRLNFNAVEMENAMAELKIKEKAEQRHRQRLDTLKALIDQSETLGEEAISVNVVKSLFEAKSKKFADQSLEDHKELLTAIPEEPEPKQLPPELKALKRFSEVCCIC